ncbi:MAG: chemotaxis protein CheW [Telluria sp.]
MKVMVFHIGRERYGLPLAAVWRVVPVAQLTQLPHAPNYIAGLLDLHGEPVPVVDLSRLAGMTSDAVRYDTRILLVDYRTPGGALHKLGLKAERVSGIANIDDGCLGPSGVAAAPFLGAVASTEEGILQVVDLDALLPAEVRAVLFQPEAA